MAYYRDLERCDYFDQYIETAVLELTAVGWLEKGWAYTQGECPSAFVNQLASLLGSVWDPIRFRGKHRCQFCGLDAEEGADIGATNLLVPRQDHAGLYVAPSLVLHYVRAHGYEPPAEFQAALMACPRTDSSSYFRRIGGIVPAAPCWRDGLHGYWNCMGEAIARESGLMSYKQWSACFETFRAGRRSFSAGGLAAEPPGWFVEKHLRPLAALREQLKREGDHNGAQALERWLDPMEFLGRYASQAS